MKVLKALFSLGFWKHMVKYNWEFLIGFPILLIVFGGGGLSFEQEGDPSGALITYSIGLAIMLVWLIGDAVYYVRLTKKG